MILAKWVTYNLCIELEEPLITATADLVAGRPNLLFCLRCQEMTILLFFALEHENPILAER